MLRVYKQGLHKLTSHFKHGLHSGKGNKRKLRREQVKYLNKEANYCSKCILYTSLIMERADISETSVKFHQTTSCSNPDHRHLPKENSSRLLNHASLLCLAWQRQLCTCKKRIKGLVKWTSRKMYISETFHVFSHLRRESHTKRAVEASLFTYLSFASLYLPSERHSNDFGSARYGLGRTTGRKASIHASNSILRNGNRPITT
jgi:hypothetical protein